MENQPQSKKPIYKRWWFWVLAPIALFIFLGVISVGSNTGNNLTPTSSEPTTKTSAPTTQQQTSWHLVKLWSGGGAKKTEPFTITGKQWRITWSNVDTTGFGGTILQVMVYKPGGSLPLEVAVNAQEGSDVSYIYKSGMFYLDINAANGNWTIKVEELK